MEPERRNDRSERIAVRLAVELGHGDFRDPFAADALNVSKGGISMRAPCLPDLGSLLLCRFRCMPSGTEVTAKGEVVWAHLDGTHSGEFGLAFVDLDPQTEWLIEEMIAEHAAWSGDASSDSGPRVATLELEGSPEPIEARLARSERGSAVFEQELDLLALGRGVRAHAPGSATLPGSIAAVELRMVGAVPMLAVTVAFDRPSAYALEAPKVDREPLREEPLRVPSVVESSAARSSGDRAPVVSAEAASGSHDTEPDLIAPGALAPRKAQSKATQLTLAEFALESEPAAPSQPVRTACAEPEDDVAAALAAEEELEALLPPEAQLEAAPGLDQAPEADDDYPFKRDPFAQFAPAEAPAARAPAATPKSTRASQPAIALDPLAPARRFKEPDFEREFSREFDLDLGDDLDLDLDGDGARAPAWKPLLVALLRRCRSSLGAIARSLAAMTQAFSRAALPQVRGSVQQLSSRSRAVYRAQLAPQLGALRRLLLSSKRRRVTAGPAPSKRPAPAAAPIGRTLLLGVVAAAALGFGVYALLPTRGEDRVDLHRKVKHHARAAGSAEPAATDAPVDMQFAPEPAAGAAPAAVAAPAAAKLAPASVVTKAPAAAQPTPATANEAKSSAARKLRFGAAQVPGGRQFALRMSGRITGLQGSADPGGFTVVINGGLSLDRAGPISSALKVVSRAMIINKGDHAEFSVRFVDGKKPLYQISADGGTLYVVIQDV